MTWPDGGNTPFRGEKATNWEGGYPRADGDPLAGRDQARHDLQRDVLALGPDPDLLRGRRRSGRRGQVPEGLPGRRQDLQGPPRRLQPDAVLQGRGEGVAAQGVPLLERRRRTGRDPCRSTGRSSSRSRSTRASTSGGGSSPIFAHRSSTTCVPIRSSAATESIEYDKWFVDRAFVIVPSQAVVGAVARELQGVPDPAEARELQPRRGDGEVGAEELKPRVIGSGGVRSRRILPFQT